MSAQTATPETLVDCSKVIVRVSDIPGAGAGAYAACDIPEGELVEKGLARVLTDLDGHVNPFVFTWSDDNPNTTWALASGCATFYNTCADDAANTHMIRDFDKCAWEIRATRDIKAGDELVHVYKSKRWRGCFKDALADV